MVHYICGDCIIFTLLIICTEISLKKLENHLIEMEDENAKIHQKNIFLTQKVKKLEKTEKYLSSMHFESQKNIEIAHQQIQENEKLKAKNERINSEMNKIRLHLRETQKELAVVNNQCTDAQTKIKRNETQMNESKVNRQSIIHRLSDMKSVNKSLNEKILELENELQVERRKNERQICLSNNQKSLQLKSKQEMTEMYAHLLRFNTHLKNYMPKIVENEQKINYPTFNLFIELKKESRYASNSLITKQNEKNSKLFNKCMKELQELTDIIHEKYISLTKHLICIHQKCKEKQISIEKIKEHFIVYQHMIEDKIFIVDQQTNEAEKNFQQTQS